MDAKRPQALLLSDALILIVATAIGLAPIRTTDQASNELFVREGWQYEAEAELARWISYASPVLLSLSLAVPILLFRRARGQYKQILSCPGFILSASVAIGVITLGAHSAILFGLGPLQSRQSLIFVSWASLIPFSVSHLVLGAWVAILLADLRERHMGWPDRLGRVLSFLWIGLLFLGYTRTVLLHAW